MVETALKLAIAVIIALTVSLAVRSQIQELTRVPPQLEEFVNRLK